MSKQKYNQLIGDLTSYLADRGIDHKRLKKAAKHPFHGLTKEEIEAQLQAINALLKDYETLDPNHSKKEATKSIVLQKGLVAVDSSIFGTIVDTDYVEILDIKTLAPIYRCTDTFKATNYSVEEILSYSSLILFDRPSWVTTKLLKLVKEITLSPQLINMSDFPTYIMQETLSMVGAQYLITHRYVCPLTRIGEADPCAILTTFRFQPCNQDNSVEIHIH